jgi:hypothetical protein
MGRFVAWALASVAVIAVATSGTASYAVDGGRAQYEPKPRLALVDLTPLTVRGSSFEARERVTVTLDGGKRGTKRVQATRQGRFTVSFAIAPVTGCRTLTIRALGSQGSRAFRQLPRPDCREP